MKNRMKLIFATVFVFLFSIQVFSQEMRGIRRGVATMIFSSIGGAVLGLSTLPFYGQPEEHTQNISNGALLGLIAGGAYLLYQVDNEATPNQARLDLTIPQAYPHHSVATINQELIPSAYFHWEF